MPHHPHWQTATAVIALGVTLPLVAAVSPAEAAYRRTANLQVVATGVGSVKLDWADVSGAPGYRVRFSTSSTMASSHAAWFRASTGTVTGLRPGAKYYFTSAVARPTGYALGAYTPAPYPAAVPQYAGPGGLREVSHDTGSVKLAWAAVTGAPGYRVRWSTATDMSNASTGWFATPAATITGLRPGVGYHFTVAVAPRTGADLGPLGAAPLTVVTSTAPTAPPVQVPARGTFDLHTATFNISTVNADAKDAPHDPWATRKSVVASQILGQTPLNETSPSADVVALQEASQSRTNGTLTQFADLLVSLNAQKSGSEHYLGVPGNSQATHIAYNDTDVAMVSSGVLTWADQETVVDPIRSMPWAIFQVRSTGAKFFFASVHLETASESIRRAQWGELIAKVPGLSQGLPVVFGGDFNSPRGGSSQCPTPANPTASAMLPQMKPAGFGDTLGQEACGKDLISTSRAASVVNGNINSVNSWNRTLAHYTNTDWIGQQVDYLFASNNLQVKRWEQVADQQNYTFQGVIPSDHNMLRATVTIPAS
ncbi:MAG: hypothetical protein JWR20_14 [Marmoricola sp.]|nr:hypothetical protein [Marmoricola sp.]